MWEIISTIITYGISIAIIICIIWGIEKLISNAREKKELIKKMVNELEEIKNKNTPE